MTQREITRGIRECLPPAQRQPFLIASKILHMVNSEDLTHAQVRDRLIGTATAEPIRDALDQLTGDAAITARQSPQPGAPVIFTRARHECGQPTKYGRPCKVEVAAPGMPCQWHRPGAKSRKRSL